MYCEYNNYYCLMSRFRLKSKWSLYAPFKANICLLKLFYISKWLPFEIRCRTVVNIHNMNYNFCSKFRTLHAEHPVYLYSRLLLLHMIKYNIYIYIRLKNKFDFQFIGKYKMCFRHFDAKLIHI